MSVLDPFHLIIGLDTEFVRISEKDNRIVSYQYALYNPRNGKRGSGVIKPGGPRHHHRYSLGGAVGKVLEIAEREGFIDSEDGKLPAKLSILVAAYFSRADIPAFRDFRKLKRRFSVLRGTYATTERPAIFDVPIPGGRRRRVTIRLCDPKLIAPAQAGSLKALGELLGYPKLSVPDVIDENGNVIPGITRMDLTAIQHPEAFEIYARRDAEIAVDWVVRFASFVDRWELPKLSPTIGSMAVAKLRSFAEQQLPDILGRISKRRRLSGVFLPEASNIQGIAADAYHGGRNECYRHGLHRAVSADRPILDLDLKGAYVTAMSPSRAADWAGIEQTTDIKRLAVLDAMSFAAVDFEFPSGTIYPSLPVHAGGHGLLYPLKGSTTVPGPELIVALNQGAQLTVRAGIVLPWLDDQPAENDLPFVTFARTINEARLSFRKGSAEELMAKEAGNSLYGKTAQAVGNMKTAPEERQYFDSRDGSHKPVPPSSITAPIIAAYASGLPRALLSEILSRLPDPVRVISATTDGLLADCTDTEVKIATSGPVARYFARWRARVDPNHSKEILEVKHRATEVLVVRTRHSATVALAAPQGDAVDHAYMLARGSHRLDKQFEFDPTDDASRLAARKAEVDEMIRITYERTYESVLERRTFISPRDQWQTNADLTDKQVRVRVSLDYDFKRQPIDVHENGGMLNFDTRPWPDLEAFNAMHKDFTGWSGQTRSVLKTMADWSSFQVWRGSPTMHSAGRRTPWQQAILVAWAQGRPGFPIRSGRAKNGSDPSLAEVTEILTAAGIPDATRDILMWVRRKAPDPTGTVSGVSEDDVKIRQALRAHLSDEALDSVLVSPPEKTPGNGSGKRSKKASETVSERVEKDEPANIPTLAGPKPKYSSIPYDVSVQSRNEKNKVFQHDDHYNMGVAGSCEFLAWGVIGHSHDRGGAFCDEKQVVLGGLQQVSQEALETGPPAVFMNGSAGNGNAGGEDVRQAPGEDDGRRKTMPDEVKKTPSMNAVFTYPGREEKAKISRAREVEKIEAKAKARAIDRSGVNDRSGGEASRWAANRLDDGLMVQSPVVLSRDDAETIMKAALAAAGPRRKGRSTKPAFDVSMNEMAARERLVIYRDRLILLARAGKPPTVLLAGSIVRDVARLDKLNQARAKRYQRWLDADHPEINPEMYDDSDPGFDEFYRPLGPDDV